MLRDTGGAVAGDTASINCFTAPLLGGIMLLDTGGVGTGTVAGGNASINCFTPPLFCESMFFLLIAAI